MPHVADALRLRRQFRVVGSLVGCLPRAASQVQWSGLPLPLSPEEVNLLVAEEKVARLVGKIMKDSWESMSDSVRPLSCRSSLAATRRHRRKHTGPTSSSGRIATRNKFRY